MGTISRIGDSKSSAAQRAAQILRDNPGELESRRAGICFIAAADFSERQGFAHNLLNNTVTIEEVVLRPKTGNAAQQRQCARLLCRVAALVVVDQNGGLPHGAEPDTAVLRECPLYDRLPPSA